MVGPDRLEDGFTVLLQSTQQVSSLHYANNLHALSTLTAARPPDLIIIHVARSRKACKPGQISIDEISEVLAHWPEATTIALVDDPHLLKEVGDLGIDLGLLQGVSPIHFLRALRYCLMPGKVSKVDM